MSYGPRQGSGRRAVEDRYAAGLEWREPTPGLENIHPTVGEWDLAAGVDGTTDEMRIVVRDKQGYITREIASVATACAQHEGMANARLLRGAKALQDAALEIWELIAEHGLGTEDRESEPKVETFKRALERTLGCRKLGAAVRR